MSAMFCVFCNGTGCPECNYSDEVCPHCMQSFDVCGGDCRSPAADGSPSLSDLAVDELIERLDAPFDSRELSDLEEG